MLLVDTNVILDVIQNDPKWAAWSQAQLDAASLKFTLVINPVIYAELSIAYRRIEELEAMLGISGLRMESIPREALFLAGRAFLKYRQRRGTRTGVLPDFFQFVPACEAFHAALNPNQTDAVPEKSQRGIGGKHHAEGKNCPPRDRNVVSKKN